MTETNDWAPARIAQFTIHKPVTALSRHLLFDTGRNSSRLCVCALTDVTPAYQTQTLSTLHREGPELTTAEATSRTQLDVAPQLRRYMRAASKPAFIQSVN